MKTEFYPEWIKTNVVPVTADTIATHGRIYLVDVTSNAVDIQLPAASIAQPIVVKHTGGDPLTNALTVTPPAGIELDGELGTISIESDLLSLTFVSDGTNWFIV